MPEQRTFTSYGTAVANGADGAWAPDERTVRPAFPTDPHPAAGDDPVDARRGGADGSAAVRDGSSDRSEDDCYVTFGCVEFRPRERE